MVFSAAAAAATGCNGDPCLDDGPVWKQNQCAVSSTTEAATSSTTDSPDPQTTTGTPTPTSDPTPTTGDTDTSATTTPVDTTTTTTADTDTTSTTLTTDTTDTTPDTDTSTTAPPPGCGDMQVDPGEDCDDGNKDDSDACTNTCTDAKCGDGIVGPGEGCDDGNDIDDDECTNKCANPNCGDGVLQPGEDCDDNNNVDTDACLNTCKTAICGDGVVQAGVEICDDANDDETDDCTSKCLPPTCVDADKNGSETDVDCGGDTCEGCGFAKSCASDGDCISNLCQTGICTWPTSCLQIHTLDDKAPDGIYTIDPDANGNKPPIKVYCDQTTDGGGWTMLFKLSAGVNGDPDSLWNGPAVNENDVALLGITKSAKHYVSSFITNFWNSNNVEVDAARVHIYKAGTLTRAFKYDTVGIDKLAWYDPTHLVSSPYLDMIAPFNHYSIFGEGSAGRRFHINRSYPGCAGDIGWLTIDTAPDPCSWETNNGDAPIRILYAPGTTLSNWNTEVNAKTLGVGDVFAIFIR